VKRNGLIRLLLSYLPVFFVTISALVFLFFIVMTEYAKKEGEHANTVFAEQVLQAFEASVMFVEQMAVKEVLTNDAFQQFVDGVGEQDPMVGYQVASGLSDLLVASPLADSAYLYRTSDDRVLSTNQIISLDQFTDKPYVNAVMSGAFPFDWSNTRIYREIGSEKERPVISLAKRIPLGNGERGLLVVNISVARLSDLFKDMSRSELSYLSMRDSTGQVFAGSREQKTAPSDKELVMLPSTIGPWELHAGVRYKGLHDVISVLSAVWLIVGALVVLLGLLWLMALIRRNHKPLQSIVNRIHSYAASKLDLRLQEGEFKYIESAIDALLRETREGQAYRNKRYFREILDGTRLPDKQEWQEEQSQLPWPEAGSRITVLVLEIDRYGEFIQTYGERDATLLQYVISNVLSEMADSSGMKLWSEWISPSRLGGILMRDTEMPGDGQQLPGAAVCEQLRAWVESNLQFTVSIGTGEEIARTEDIPLAFDEGLYALEFRPALGLNRVIPRNTLLPTDKLAMYGLLQSISDFAQRFRLAEEEWEASFKQLFGSVEEGVFSRDDLAGIMNYLIYSMNRSFTDMSSEHAELWKQETLPRMEALLSEFYTIGELRKKLLQVFQETAAQIRMIQESKSHYALMKNAKAYIEEHYADPDLSLMLVSDRLNISSSHLSRLFKEQHGEKFVDYIAQYRMTAAKELLSSTSRPVQDVAREVGYLHSFSFIRTFKKLCGQTPGEYREEHAGTRR
jgi:AraC-like DNA-binding protein